ncbi:MAG: hypothetical protein EOO20_22685 [Chryseobacterium sp.]|nr:MAG: hypothetical protein EOO20_22685 [Chryseobacterium sp.]
MNKRMQVCKNLMPYGLLAIAGIIAFAPVSFMLLSLKNDILSIDYPIKYFISQCIQNGSLPFWFNTWAMGFPIESFLTWSIFSPLQLLTGLCGVYNIYWLHGEFMFYVLLSGWGMYGLLQQRNNNVALHWILACSYMLSGFIVGSSQWFTYITAAAFLPLLAAAYLNVLQLRGARHIALFAAVFYIMLTSVYPAFMVISCYLLAVVSIYFLLREKTRENHHKNQQLF